ncbi:LPS export ABC transporter periplasmic protein LptC, partial [Candidatus Pelagibacter sp.]|nr:LPS export ABC transporter periplasmic protein LptC [Candidatus Pelagibacter sp.]
IISIMNKVIQTVLICLAILVSYIFYKIYLSDSDKISVEQILPEDPLNQMSENNLIKNLRYEIKLNQENQYIITSDLSELIYIDNNEIVKMQKVKAIFLGQDKIPLIITSKYAEYNKFNHNTLFKNNVIIEYINNKIYSDKLDLNIKNNLAKIFENVRYVGQNGEIFSDNIKINLLTKKIDIYMNDETNKVKVKKD